MRSKILNILSIFALATSVTPIIANAETIDDKKENVTSNNDTGVLEINKTILEKYPKLKVIKNENLNRVNFSENIYQELEKVITDLNTVSKSKDINLLNNAIKKALDLHEITGFEDTLLHSENDQFDYIIFNSISLIFELTEGNEKLRNETLSNLADNMYISTANKFNSFKKGDVTFLTRYAQYLTYNVGDNYINDETTKNTLLYSFCTLNALSYLSATGSASKPGQPETVVDLGAIPSKMNPDVVPPPPEIPDAEEIPPIIPPTTKPEGDGVQGAIPKDNDLSVSSDYVYKEGNCYKVYVYRDENSKIVSQEQEIVEKTFCSIDDTPLPTLEEYNNENKVDITLEVWNSLAENDLNQLSNNTIQFTINKSKEKPYYYDTGIKASSDDTITFTQLKDSLLQLITKTNAYVLEDKDKIMFIAEGKPLIIINKDKEFSASEVENLLNSFKDIGLKIDEKKSLDGESLETRLSENELNTIKFKENDVVLRNTPQIKDGILQLPFIQISELVGYTVQEGNDKITLTYKNDDKDITIELIKNTKNLIINGSNKITSTSSQVIDNTTFAEVNLILKELGYSLIFDIDSGTIEIK